jgi:glycosyltransferase involved in cell wall biosynthesis
VLLWARPYSDRVMDRRVALPTGVIDEPSDGQLVDCGYLFIRGWALADPFVSRAEVTINGQLAGRTRLGLPRPDLGEVIHLPAAAVCGFDFEVDIARWAEPASDVRVEITATTVDGTRFSLPPLRLRTKPLTSASPATDFSFKNSGRPVYVPAANLTGIKVALFIHDLLRAGSQLRLLELLDHLAGRPGLSFTVVSPTDGPMRAELALIGVPVHICGSYSYENPEQYEQRVHELSRWFERENFNLVWASTLVSFIGLEVAQATGVPSLFTVHESQNLPVFWGQALATGAMSPTAYQRARTLFLSASKVAFVCDAQKRIFEQYEVGGNFTVVPNAIEVWAIEALRAETQRESARAGCGVGPPERLVLCSGIISPRKSQTVLALASYLTLPHHPATVIAMVGDIGGAYAEGLRSYLDRAGLGSKIRILPISPDISQWYLAADLLVSASVDEAQPSVVLEAMAFGVPVLSTRVGGVAEVIEDGVNGLLCEPGDVAELAHAFDKALGLAEEPRRRMIEASRKRVRQNHDAAKAAEGFLQLIRELAGGIDFETLPQATRFARDLSPQARQRLKEGDVDLLLQELSANGDSYELVGIDMALAMAVDLAVEGVAPSSPILAVGPTVETVCLLLSDMGYRVTGVEGGGPRSGLDEAAIQQHLARSDAFYDIALVVGLGDEVAPAWPETASSTLQQQSGILAELCKRVRRSLYVEVPVDEGPAQPFDPHGQFSLARWLLENDLATGFEMVASTVGAGGQPRRLCRVNLR